MIEFVAVRVVLQPEVVNRFAVGSVEAVGAVGAIRAICAIRTGQRVNEILFGSLVSECEPD